MSRVAIVLVAASVLVSTASAVTYLHIIRVTKSYTLTLSVGSKEMMYTQAQVKAKHPTDGEVMLGDGMSMGGMSMGAGNRHLEVAVVSRATGKRLSLKPTIMLTDTNGMSGMAMSDPVDAMAMYGIREGMSDLHYGNNVKLTAGHAYKVVVTVKGEKASFSFHA